jgi:hypothetical protein
MDFRDTIIVVLVTMALFFSVGAGTAYDDVAEDCYKHKQFHLGENIYRCELMEK